MNPLCFRRAVLALASLVVPLLGGCATQGGATPDPAMERLQISIDQCLQQQEQSVTLLQTQVEQLQQQGQRLDELSGQLAAAEEKKSTARSAPVVATSCKVAEAIEDKLIIGRQEQIWLPDLGFALTARVDTGAETASLDARDVELFERNGRRWVRFFIARPDGGEPIELERKVSRMVAILQSNSKEPERRPVIELGMVLGPLTQTAEFTLTNRSHLDHQMMIGRNVLQDLVIVDVSRKNIAPFQLPDGGSPGKTR